MVLDSATAHDNKEGGKREKKAGPVEEAFFFRLEETSCTQAGTRGTGLGSIGQRWRRKALDASVGSSLTRPQDPENSRDLGSA